MSFVTVASYDFAGAATTRGAAFGDFLQQEVFNDPCMKLDGSGNLVTATPSGFASYTYRAANFARYKWTVNWRGWDTSDTNFEYMQPGRWKNNHITGGFYQGVWARLRYGNATTAAFGLYKAVSGSGVGSFGTFADITVSNGMLLGISVECEETGGNVLVTAKIWNQASPGTIIATISGTVSDVSIVATDTRNVAIADEGSAYVTSNWGADSALLEQWVSDADPPTITAAELLPSGNQIKVTLTDATLPITSSTNDGLTGLSVTASGGAASILDARVVSPYLSITVGRTLLGGETVSLSGTSVDVTDSASPANQLANFSGRSVTNHSTQISAAASIKGFGVMGTRGMIGSYSNGSSMGKEGMSSFLTHLPYGLDAGWSAIYGGSTSDNRDLNITGALVAIFQPNQPMSVLQLQFNGSDGIVYALDEFSATDPTQLSILPGSYAYWRQIYNWADGLSGVPANHYGGYCWTSTNSNSLQIDGSRADDIGTYTLDDLYAWDGTGEATETSAGLSHIQRLYRPWAIVGRPHPSYAGREKSIFHLGNSIASQQNDWDSTGLYPCSGYIGRWLRDQVPWVTFGISGGSIGSFAANISKPILTYILGSVDRTTRRKVTVAVDEFGINDMRDQSGQAQGTKATSLWNARKTNAALVVARGAKYLHTTLTPMGNFDAWLTGNPAYGDAAAQQAQFVADRAEFNEKVLTESSSIPGCIAGVDAGGAVETDPANHDNGQVVGAFGDDQLHPNGTGHTDMAAALAASTALDDHPNLLPFTDSKPSAAMLQYLELI